MVKKKISSDENRKEAFWETALWCVTSTHWALGELWLKGKYPQINQERSFLKNCFMFCEFISESYSFPLQNRSAKTVLVEFARGYLEGHRGLWWKKQYPQMKTGKKISEILLCDVWLPVTELQLYFMELCGSLISVKSENWYFGSLWRPQGQRKYPPIKMRKKLSEKLLCDLWIHLTELQLSPQEAFC